MQSVKRKVESWKKIILFISNKRTNFQLYDLEAKVQAKCFKFFEPESWHRPFNGNNSARSPRRLMQWILHVHRVGWCIPLKGRLQLYAFCNTNHHGKWKQHVISPQLAWKQRAATHCNLPVFPKTDLKNHSNRGFDEMTSIVTGSFLELLLAVHDASTDCIDVSVRVGLRPILPLGTEIVLTLVAWKWNLGGHPFLRHACPFLDSPRKEKQLRVSSKVGSRESKNRHVWQDHFWARAYKRLPSLFRDLTSIAAWFKLFSKPFANHLLFQSTRYLELWRSFHRNLYWNGFSGLFLGTQKVAIGSCICFQARCGEIQCCFMRYCRGPDKQVWRLVGRDLDRFPAFLPNLRSGGWISSDLRKAGSYW